MEPTDKPDQMSGNISHALHCVTSSVRTLKKMIEEGILSRRKIVEFNTTK